MKKFFLYALAAVTLVSCNLFQKDDDDDDPNQPVSTIPSDDDADPNPAIKDTTVTLPGVSASFTSEEGEIVIRLDMTGVKDPSTGDYIKLYGTGDPKQNVWVEVDGEPKGISVQNISEGGYKSKIDIVFLVDNSGSMGDEADGVASSITSWASLLAESGLNVKFGCVGYGYYVGSQYDYPTTNYGIAGGMDMANYSELNTFLNGRGYSGVARTYEFYGAKGDFLANKAANDEEQWTVAGGECSVQAMKFAEKYFSFRDDASRVYVNFTDDYNYPGGDERWSITDIRKNWNAARGTIHTVFSNDSAWYSYNRDYYQEPSWYLSEITGGSITWVSSSFYGVTLDNLEVTAAMQNSYIIRLTNINLDGKVHEVKITVKSADGSIAGSLVVPVKFSK